MEEVGRHLSPPKKLRGWSNERATKRPCPPGRVVSRGEMELHEPPRQASFHGFKVSNKGTRINLNPKKRGVSDSTPGLVDEKIHKVPKRDLQLVNRPRT